MSQHITSTALEAATVKPAIRIVGNNVYKVTSDSGNSYGVVRGKCSCRGFKSHGHCKHSFFVSRFQAAIKRAQQEREAAARREARGVNDAARYFLFGY